MRTNAPESPTKPLTARAVWDAYVAQCWLPPVERPLGRKGNTITTENPNAHLARDLRYKSYDAGRYVIECCDEYRTAWAKKKLTHSLAVNLTTFARALGVERQVSVEFVTRKETEKF